MEHSTDGRFLGERVAMLAFGTCTRSGHARAG